MGKIEARITALTALINKLDTSSEDLIEKVICKPGYRFAKYDNSCDGWLCNGFPIKDSNRFSIEDLIRLRKMFE